MKSLSSRLSFKKTALFLFVFLISFGYMYSSAGKMYVEKVILPSYYGYSYDINWDGHDAYLYSYVSDFDTSTSYPIKVGTDYDGANEWGRGHVQYDLSSIPSNAKILSVGLEFDVSYVGQWSDEWDSHKARIKIYSMWRDQSYYSPHDGDVYTYDLFNDADDGTLYGLTGYITMDTQFDKYYPSDTSWFDLGPACVDTVQSRIESGIEWIGLGFTHYDPNEDLDEGVNLFGKSTKLHIVYQPADVPILLHPSVLPDSGDINTVFKFSIDYLDSTGYEPDTALLTIDDTVRIPLILTSGSATNGTYSVKTTVSDTGWHRYYFRFVNSNGNSVQYPSNAPDSSLTGPYVEYNFGVSDIKNTDTNEFSWFERDGNLTLKSSNKIDLVTIYSINGSRLFRQKYGSYNVIIPIRNHDADMLFCKIKLKNGENKLIKILNIR